MSQEKSQNIDGNHKQVLILTQADTSALAALLYSFHDNPEVIRAINKEHQLCLGANHVESLTEMWQTLFTSIR